MNRRPQQGLSPGQARVLAFIDAELEAGRRFPSPKAIAAHMAWKSDQTARDTLSALKRKGYLAVWREGRRRRFERIPDDEAGHARGKTAAGGKGEGAGQTAGNPPINRPAHSRLVPRAARQSTA